MLTCSVRVLLGASVLLGLAACGEEPAPVVGIENDGGFSPLPDASSALCSEGQTQACTCPATGNQGERTGSQACYGGSWLVCNCGPVLGPPPSTAGTCLPGRYEGSFSGEYRSGFCFGCGIPVEALDFSGRPGLAFTLEEQSSGACGEFCDFTISDGYVKGTANGVFPFEGVLTGTLDCATKEFTGELEGCYALGLGLGINEGRFKGPIRGTYDGVTHSFTIGSWDVLEKDVAVGFLGEVGGNGTWESTYNPNPTSPPPDEAPGCTLGIGMGGTSNDAGVAPTSDAGV